MSSGVFVVFLAQFPEPRATQSPKTFHQRRWCWSILGPMPSERLQLCAEGGRRKGKEDIWQWVLHD